jgi:hypothetical protein
MPVHAGRVPALAVERMRAIKGMGRPAVLVTVYGNRAFDDALLELRDLATELEFVPVAGAAFIGQHSFSTPEFPVAQGRPDMADRDRAAAFGRHVRDKLAGISNEAELRNLPELRVPGNFPYRDGVQAAPISRKPRARPACCAANAQKHVPAQPSACVMTASRPKHAVPSLLRMHQGMSHRLTRHAASTHSGTRAHPARAIRPAPGTGIFL